MPRNLFTPVTIRRRSAAQGCANAQPDRGPPEGRWVALGSGKPRSVSGMIGELAFNYDLINSCNLTLYQHQLTPTNQPVQAEQDPPSVESSTGSIHHDFGHRQP